MTAPSPAMILLSALIECGGVAEARAFLASKHQPRTDAALRLLDSHGAGADIALAILRDMGEGTPSSMPSLAPEEWGARFDRAVALNPEASVALYSLADPALLAATTEEMVALMARFGLIDAQARILEIGCGIGRFAAALAPLVRHYAGIDVAPRMVEAARRRCDRYRNVDLAVAGGHDLAGFGDASRDLALAVDVFPYLVASGGTVARRHIEEAARVLTPGGALLIMNYSYRNDVARDRAELADYASAAGFVMMRNGTADTEIWDGVTFLMRRAS